MLVLLGSELWAAGREQREAELSPLPAASAPWLQGLAVPRATPLPLARDRWLQGPRRLQGPRCPPAQPLLPPLPGVPRAEGSQESSIGAVAAPGRSTPFYTGCNRAGLVRAERSILYTSRSRPASPFPAPVAAGARSKDTPLFVLPPAGSAHRQRAVPELPGHGSPLSAPPARQGGHEAAPHGHPQLCAGSHAAGASPWGSGSRGTSAPPAPCGARGHGQHRAVLPGAQSKRDVSREPWHQPLSLLQLPSGTS